MKGLLTVAEIKSMNWEELLEEMALLNEEIASIESQLEGAKVKEQATGKPVNAEWQHRARTAQRFKTLDRQAIQREISERKRISKSESATQYEHIYVETCKRLLPEDWRRVIELEVHMQMNAEMKKEMAAR